jgi:L,D-transpeptidase YcbB
MIRLAGVLVVAMAFAIFFGSSSCRNKISEYIDTVACPVDPTVDKIKVALPYYNNRVKQKTKAFYEANGFKKEWLGQKDANKQYKAFADEVRESYQYGMNPDDYKIDELDQAIEELYDNRKRTDEDVSNLDIKITASFFLFTTHLLEGRVRRPGAQDFIWKRGMPAEDDVDILLSLKTASDVRKQFKKLQPEDPQYDHLKEALALYRKLEAEDKRKWQLASTKSIRPLDAHELIPNIRRRLLLTNSKIKNPVDTLKYDEHLVEAVKQFQRSHGLKDEGIIEDKTLVWLTMPFGSKAELIALNLERLRWRPYIRDDQEAVVVNVPEYMMRVQKNDKKLLEMRVVLGTEYNPTPIFSDTLKYIVFSPTWNVPPKIFEEEFLPNLRQNPSYYSETFKFLKDGIEVDPSFEPWNDENINPRAYQAIQQPGVSNSLGFVKFVMPNNFNIYLHDTPADRLFNKQERAFSHGCVRLEKPFDFAVFLLEGQKQWTREKILEAMNSPEPIHANLKKPYPVHIVYRTTWVDENGLVNFREDVYGHDQRHLNQLKEASAKPLAYSK